jgi:hypothetical protein
VTSVRARHALLLAAFACGTPPAPSPVLAPEEQPLAAISELGFRAAFEGMSDRPRLIVALSPT